MRTVLLLLSSLLLCGCFTREVCVEVQPDGTGFLEVDTWVRQALIEYTRRETGLPPEEWWFTRETLEKAARGYGLGVRYLEHSIQEEGEGRRFRVRYRFDDIRELRVGLDPSLPFLLTPPDRTRNQALPPYRFELPEPGHLVVRPPAAPPPPPRQPYARVEAREVARQREERHRADLNRLMRHGNPFRLSGKETPEELVTTLGAEMRFRLVVESRTGLEAASATHVEDGRVILFDFEVRRLLEDEEFRRLATEGNLHQLSWAEICRLRGGRVETAEVVRLRMQPEASED